MSHFSVRPSPTGMFIPFFLDLFHVLGVLVLVVPLSTWLHQPTGKIRAGAIVCARLSPAGDLETGVIDYYIDTDFRVGSITYKDQVISNFVNEVLRIVCQNQASTFQTYLSCRLYRFQIGAVCIDVE